MKKGFALPLIILSILLLSIVSFFILSRWKNKTTEKTIGGTPVGIVLANNGKFYIVDVGFFTGCGFDCLHYINPVFWVFDPQNNRIDSISIPYNFENTCTNKGVVFSTKIIFGCNDKTTVFDTSFKNFDTDIFRITGDDKLLVDSGRDLLHTYYSAFSLNNFQPTLASIKPKFLDKEFGKVTDFAVRDNAKYIFGCFGSGNTTNGEKGVLEIIDQSTNNSDEISFDGCIKKGLADSTSRELYIVENVNRSDKLIKYDLNARNVVESLDLGDLQVTYWTSTLVQDQNSLYLVAGTKPEVDEENSYLFVIKKDNLSDNKKIDISDLGIRSHLISMTVLNGKIYAVGSNMKQEPILAIYNKEGEFINKLNLRKESKVKI